MKNKILTLALGWLVLLGAASAQDFVNLTPMAKSMQKGTGQLTLPTEFGVSTAGLPEEMKTEAERFVAHFNAATGYAATTVSADEEALVKVELPVTALGEEAYNLSVTAEGVTIQASTATGLFYAFQTLKKMLPANVMAGARDESVTSYTLPVVEIKDAPRFGYRGFMLDVARHFFTIEEVKRMIDLMACYKMNRFHWHLSDDQGWRVEIKKYPKLTSVGSIAPNAMFTDMYSCTQYWINKPYGPYFYTQDELREVVAYAKERHVEIVPEIDMPGHFVAAMASYPEYSCSPNGSHVIWTTGGISSDVLNVANPEAVQFAKDILAELIDVFPYETIHIGGDECPTTAWENNAECQARYQELGLTNYRQLQSHFIKEMADFVHEKGRKLAVWNEAITAGSADVETVKSTDALVYCWTGPEAAAKKAAELGLHNIYTPWGPYYINRKQGNSPQDPPGAGYGTDDVKATYNQSIPAETDYGVQGTFWTEHVSDREYMEWLALPRLIAIAEAGWTPQSLRSFADFQKRMTADTLLLNYGDYRYCKYHMLDDGTGEEPSMVLPKVNTESHKYYYRLISGSTDARKDRCVELLAEGSPLLTTYASNNAVVGRLWTNAQAAEGDDNYECQWWSLEENPENPGNFALVCMAAPEGSVNPVPTAESNAGRWDYDYSQKHYNFQLGTAAYGTVGDNYYYSIASDQLAGKYLNSSLGGQGFAVNVYGNPSDGNGGRWQFAPKEDYSSGVVEPAPIVPLTDGGTYAFANSVEGFDGTWITDNGKGSNLTHSTDPFSANAWKVVNASLDTSLGVQTFQFQNVQSGRFISGSTAFVNRMGYPVTVAEGESGATLTLTYDAKAEEYRLLVDGHSLFPLPAGQVNAGATIGSDATYDAPRLQGATWKAQPVRVVTLQCADAEGNPIATYTRSVELSVEKLTEAYCPVIENFQFVSVSETEEENVYAVTYQRTSFTMTVTARDQRGALISLENKSIPVGQDVTVEVPELPYYTLVSSSHANGEKVSMTDDLKVEMQYTTTAYNGVRQLGEAVTAVEDGKSYVIYDTSPNDTKRCGYRNVNAEKQVWRSLVIEDTDPLHTWLLEASGTGYRVKNEWAGLYVPTITTQATPVTLSPNGAAYQFLLNSDGETFKIKCTSNGVCWDGVESGAMVGWNDPGHPYKLYEYYAQPYFEVRVSEVDKDGRALSTPTRTMVKAGEPFTLSIGTHEGYQFEEIQGGEGTQAVSDNLDIKVVYAPLPVDAISHVEQDSSNSPVYDLSGRRVNQLRERGIYIVGGTKVYVK